MYYLERVILGLSASTLARGWPSPGVRSDSLGLSNFITPGEETQTLTATKGSPAVTVLDYGESVEGIPDFEVVHAEGDTSVFEITYAESKAALTEYMVCKRTRRHVALNPMLTSFNY